MDGSLIEKLISNSQSDMYPFHMPGHKRRHLGKDAEKLPFELDVTEVEGFDDLHAPKSLLKTLEENAARLFCARNAFVLVNGSTCGILAAVRALTDFGDRVLIARNCHRSVYNAVGLCGLVPEYVMPGQAFDGEVPLDFYGAVAPSDVEKALEAHPDIRLCVITSPTYEGMCSDIRAIADICHTRNVRLLVDEAHGAFISIAGAAKQWAKTFSPYPAITKGADAVVVSLHKTFPALTQTALLLTNDDTLVPKLRKNISVFQTSSPSYVLTASVETCLTSLKKRNPFWQYMMCQQQFYDLTEGLKRLRILFNRAQSVHDSGKILISTAETDMSGYELAKILREKYKLETEMAAPEYVLAYTSFADTREGFERLYFALTEIDTACGAAENKPELHLIKKLPKRFFIPFEKYKYNTLTVPLSGSVGKTAAETVMAYPPGIPCIVTGEEITEEAVRYIEHIARLGGNLIFDSCSHGGDMINVADL